jgi:uncharacterized protein (DUF433 family)
MAVSFRKSKTDSAEEAERDVLIAKWVETAPAYSSPDRARIIDHGVSVTALITQLQLEGGDADAVLEVYNLPAEALAAAIAYYERHRSVIDARIVLSAARFAD